MSCIQINPNCQHKCHSFISAAFNMVEKNKKKHATVFNAAHSFVQHLAVKMTVLNAAPAISLVEGNALTCWK